MGVVRRAWKLGALSIGLLAGGVSAAEPTVKVLNGICQRLIRIFSLGFRLRNRRAMRIVSDLLSRSIRRGMVHERRKLMGRHVLIPSLLAMRSARIV
jgi:hypothetical protein